MKSTAATFLLGALVGAALALGARAAILSMDDGRDMAHGAHGDHEMKIEAPETPPARAKNEPKGFLLDLGNEMCPIMGKKVNGHTYSEWNGLRIGHCCPPCADDLLADPEKGLDEAGIEWRDAAGIVAAVKAATGEDRKALIARAKEKYRIVRMPEGGE